MLEFLLSLEDEGDRAKVEEIYRKYNNAMIKAARDKLSGKPNAFYIAEEAVQNAFIKIINHFESNRFDESEDRLRGYFVYIAIHEAINLLNQKESVYLEDLPDEIPSDEGFEEALCIRENYERVKQAILRLNDRYQVVLYQYFVEERSGPEIAKLLGMNLSTVHTIIQRGKAMLLKMLKGEIVQ